MPRDEVERVELGRGVAGHVTVAVDESSNVVLELESEAAEGEGVTIAGVALSAKRATDLRDALTKAIQRAKRKS